MPPANSRAPASPGMSCSERGNSQEQVGTNCILYVLLNPCFSDMLVLRRTLAIVPPFSVGVAMLARYCTGWRQSTAETASRWIRYANQSCCMSRRSACMHNASGAAMRPTVLMYTPCFSAVQGPPAERGELRPPVLSRRDPLLNLPERSGRQVLGTGDYIQRLSQLIFVVTPQKDPYVLSNLAVMLWASSATSQLRGDHV